MGKHKKKAKKKEQKKDRWWKSRHKPREKTESEKHSLAENLRGHVIAHRPRYDTGHIGSHHYGRSPAIPFVNTISPDPNLVKLSDEIHSLKEKLLDSSQPKTEVVKIIETPTPSALESDYSSSSDEDYYRLGDPTVQDRINLSLLPQYVSRSFDNAKDAQGNTRAIKVDWDRGGDIGIQYGAGNMKRGQRWDDVVQILTDAKVPSKDIEKVKNEFENRRHTTSGRSKGIDVKDQY
jgi:hypothetical protein